MAEATVKLVLAVVTPSENIMAGHNHMARDMDVVLIIHGNDHKDYNQMVWKFFAFLA